MFYSPYNPIWNYANYFYSYPHPSHNGVMGQTQLKEEKNIEEGNKEKTHIETSGNHNFYPAANTTTAAVVVPPVSTVPPMTRSPPLTSSLSTVPATVATAVAVPVPCVPPPSSNLFGLPDVYIYEIRVCPLVYLLAGLCIYLIGPQAIIPIVCSFFFYRWHLNKQSSSHMQAFLLNKKSNPCQSLGMYANGNTPLSIALHHSHPLSTFFSSLSSHFLLCFVCAGTYVQSNIYDDAHYTSNVSSLPVSQSQSVPPSISTSRVRRTSDSRIHSLADFKE